MVKQCQNTFSMHPFSMVLTYVLLLLCRIVCSITLTSKNYIGQPPPHSQTNVIFTVYARSKLECATICNRQMTCQSFSFDKLSKTCSCSRDTGEQFVNRKAHTCQDNVGYQYEFTLDFCYMVKTSPWRGGTQSKSACEADGGHLARVTNAPMQAFVVGLISVTAYDNIPRFFIDGTDEETEDTWKFSNGSLIVWNDWKAGNSFTGTSFNCLALWRGASFMWTDIACSGYDGGYVCQIDV